MFVDNKQEKQAFTLAEVLITIMIIAVITAMTIPGLKRYTALEENISLVKKAYSTISNATRLSEISHGEMKRWGSFLPADSDSENGSEDSTDGENAENTIPAGLARAIDYFKEQMLISRSCSADDDADSTQNCWVQTKDLNGSAYGDATNIVAGADSFSTADGMNWSISATQAPEEFGVNADGAECLLVWVDTNADQKPNVLGYDVFAFIIHPAKGVLPAGTENNSTNCRGENPSGVDCAARVISESEISY